MASHPAKRQRTEANDHRRYSEHGSIQQTPIPLPAAYLAAMDRSSITSTPTPTPPRLVETPVPVPDLSRFTASSRRPPTKSPPSVAISAQTKVSRPYPSPATSSSPPPAPVMPSTARQQMPTPAPSSSPCPSARQTRVPVPPVRSCSSSQPPPPDMLEVSSIIEWMSPRDMASLLSELATDNPIVRTSVKRKHVMMLEAARKAQEDAAEADRKTQEKAAKAAERREQAKRRRAQTKIVSFDHLSKKAHGKLNRDYSQSTIYRGEYAAGLAISDDIEKIFKIMVDKMDEPATWGTRFNAIDAMRIIYNHLCEATPGQVPGICRDYIHGWHFQFMNGFLKLTEAELSILAISGNGKWLRSFESTVRMLMYRSIEGQIPYALRRLQSFVDSGRRPVAAVDG